ncbi:hypothetical protein [Acinetobacter soli]|uniref:hypothetical protein n=1 Tax=Acinetobacter soli TaxID=487316 RepID=UPI0012503078|nr:hypothetical protein [Acinetobacter soli]
MEKIITVFIVALVFFIGARFFQYLKKSKNPPTKNLYFESNRKALEFYNSIYPVSMSKNMLNVGIVRSKDRTGDGKFHFLVELSDQQNVSGFNDKYSDEINVGDLIYWGFIEKVDEKNIIQIQAIGHVLALLEHEFNPNTKKLVVKKDLTK